MATRNGLSECYAIFRIFFFQLNVKTTIQVVYGGQLMDNASRLNLT